MPAGFLLEKEAAVTEILDGTVRPSPVRVGPTRPHRLARPRTLDFRSSDTGSNPVGGTTHESSSRASVRGLSPCTTGAYGVSEVGRARASHDSLGYSKLPSSTESTDRSTDRSASRSGSGPGRSQPLLLVRVGDRNRRDPLPQPSPDHPISIGLLTGGFPRWSRAIIG